MKVLFLGAGVSCRVICQALKEELEEIFLFDISSNNLEKTNRLLENKAKVVEEDEMFDLNVDYVIEVASVEAVRKYLPSFLEKGKKVIVLSTGAFSQKEFRDKVKSILAKNSDSFLYLAGGAIGGLDVISAIKDRILKLKLTTRKPPKSLGMDNSEKEIIFSGSVEEAINKFPKNINVAVTLAMAVGDFNKVAVEIISEPEIKRNIHQVEIFSEVGNYFFQFENYPSDNPKTSLLAPLSIISLLKKKNTNFVVGG